MEARLIRKTFFTLFILIGIVLSASCNPAQISPTPQTNVPDPATLPPSATLTVPAQVVSNGPLRYCFKYPSGYTLQVNDGQVEVIGPHSAGPGGLVAGLVWIDATDTQGHTAQEFADEEVKAFAGSPLRSTVLMGGEEALVLDGMPGQDLIRKIYIVHNELLYTLNFSPYQSNNEIANAQMETLFASVTSSWVWTSSGKSCSPDE
jgi:hypothetical protein